MPNAFDPKLVLDRPLMANLATVDVDGAPRNAPVWYHWHNDALWMLSDQSASSTRRISHNPHVAVEIVDYDNPAGILRHLGLRGQASIEPMDPALFRCLLTRYLGPEPNWNAWFVQTIARINDPKGRLIRLQPESIFTNDVSYFRSGPNLATRADPDQKDHT